MSIPNAQNTFLALQALQSDSPQSDTWVMMEHYPPGISHRDCLHTVASNSTAVCLKCLIPNEAGAGSATCMCVHQRTSNPVWRTLLRCPECHDCETKCCTGTTHRTVRKWQRALWQDHDVMTLVFIFEPCSPLSPTCNPLPRPQVRGVTFLPLLMKYSTNVP
uniref:Uncharacterized protein n=1 Tax=Eutreptiella gymnastica TaxID=73025 RepID=A0A7S1IAH5_9EUGL